jgi:hypothetical protein
MKRLVWCLVLLTSCAGHYGNQATATPDWTLHFDRVGALSRNATYGSLREIYPGVTIAFENGMPDQPKFNRWVAGFGQYIVVRINGEELMRERCESPCVLKDGNGKWTAVSTNNVEQSEVGERYPLVITSSRFRTESGIGVGSTVAELLKAYPAENGLTAFTEQIPNASFKIAERICYFPDERINSRKARPDTVEQLVFHVRPARGKKYAGNYGEQVLGGEYRTTRIDMNARIVAIEYDPTCGSPEIEVP